MRRVSIFERAKKKQYGTRAHLHNLAPFLCRTYSSQLRRIRKFNLCERDERDFFSLSPFLGYFTNAYSFYPTYTRRYFFKRYDDSFSKRYTLAWDFIFRRELTASSFSPVEYSRLGRGFIRSFFTFRLLLIFVLCLPVECWRRYELQSFLCPVFGRGFILDEPGGT